MKVKILKYGQAKEVTSEVIPEELTPEQIEWSINVLNNMSQYLKRVNKGPVDFNAEELAELAEEYLNAQEPPKHKVKCS